MSDYPIDRTPAHLRCSMGGCPQVFELVDGELLIVGKNAYYREINSTQCSIGSNESAIVINRELLSVLVHAPQNQDVQPGDHPDFAKKAQEILDWNSSLDLRSAISTALAEAVAAEREKCALTVENFSRLLAATIRSAGGRDPVAAILARGEAK